MPPENDPAFLWDMREAAHDISDFVLAMNVEEFQSSKVVRLAVERLAIILGEAAACVSEPFRAQNPEIPWRKIQRLRNTMAHTYGRGTALELFRTCREFIVPLSRHLDSLVPTPPLDDPDRAL